MLISFLIYIYHITIHLYIFPHLSPTLPSTSMHASTPLPSPPLGCPTLFYPPFPYSPYTTIASLLSTPHPSALLSFPLLPNPLIYPTFPRTPSASLPYYTPSLLYHTLAPTYPPLTYPHLGNHPLSSLLFPQLPSPALSYPLISSTSFPNYPLLASAPHPSHPFLTPLPYSPLPLPQHSLPLSPHLTYPTLPSPPPQPLPSPPLSPHP